MLLFCRTHILLTEKMRERSLAELFCVFCVFSYFAVPQHVPTNG